jgi:hypothetical protein
VRLALFLAALLLTGCGPGLVFNMSPEMTKDQMLARADHVFIGVIEKQEYEKWPFLRIPGQDSSKWRIWRRRVRVELLLRGIEPRKSVDVYEYSSTLGLSGDLNSTEDGERDLFMVRLENGRYYIVRDWFRCIFPIYSGEHDRMPLDDAHPLWERIALLNWWLGDGHRSDDWSRMDPAWVLGMWRTAKLARGFVRHPDRETRVFGCQVLLLMTRLQDECWEHLSSEDRATWSQHGLISAERLLQTTEADVRKEWDHAISGNDIDTLRLLTTVNRPTLRREFCRLFAQRFPNDHDNGCPADQPPPATIVTKDGDIPLPGPWSR